MWADDLLARFCSGRVTTREKERKPTVGFCGYAPPNGITIGTRYIKEHLRSVLENAGIARSLGISSGMETRGRAIDVLRATDVVNTQFLFRDSTYVDEYGNVGPYHQSIRYRAEYVANTLSSDYVLCTRGWGNFSFRLYETLCLGRIPVFIDTDCVLPVEDKIDWQSLCVYLAERDLKQLPDAVLSHFDAISADTYGDYQRRCRQVWELYLSPLGYFRYLRERLFERLNNRAEARQDEP